MLEKIKSVISDERFQTAILGALLGGLSTFLLMYADINVDLLGLLPTSETIEVIESE